MRNLLTLLLLAASGTALAQDVHDKVDRFTGTRTIGYTAPMGKLTDLRFTMESAVKDGTPLAQIGFVTAGLFDRRAGTAWRYLQCHDMHWLVDGTPLDLGVSNHDGRVVPGGAIEILTQYAKSADLAKLEKAQAIEYRVCSTEGMLAPSDTAAVREIAARSLGHAADGASADSHAAPTSTHSPDSDCESCKKIGGG